MIIDHFFALTHSVSHAIKKDPVGGFWSMFDKGNIVAGLYAQHGKQLQFFSWGYVCYTTSVA